VTSPGNQSYANRTTTAKDSIASGANDLYSKLGNAMSERGQMLDGLEDTVNSLRSGSENMVTQVGSRRLPNFSFDLLMTGIGEETCCRAVDAKVVQFLIYSTLESVYDYSFGRRVGEWKELRNGRLIFSCTFLRGNGGTDCVSFVGETARGV